jgi:NADPH:quinone reductase
MPRMAKAIVVREVGGPEVLRLEEVEDPRPGPGEARVRQTAVGLNFIDVYLRTGIYKPPRMPFVSGQEGAGVVEEVGPGVTEVAPGDRVAYASVPGACADVRVLAAARLVPLPADIDDRTAAAVLFKGMTAEYLLLRCAQVISGETILFHAAAGGVGSIACQWAHHLGVTVIGTAGGPEKVRRAAALGCAHVIDYTVEDVVPRVRAITGGAGVRVVFDSVGKDTFEASLDCLRVRGLLVAFGQSSGLVPPLDVRVLSAKGSLTLTRPSIGHYIATREELLCSARAVFDVVRSGAVKIEIGGTYPLAEAAAAHRDLEGRKTTGSTLLLP